MRVASAEMSWPGDLCRIRAGKHKTPVGARRGFLSPRLREIPPQAVKQHLLMLMLQAPKQVQVQLAAGLEDVCLSSAPMSALPRIAS